MDPNNQNTTPPVEPTPPQPQPAPVLFAPDAEPYFKPLKRPHKKLKILLILILLVGLGGGGYYLMQKKGNPAPKVANNKPSDAVASGIPKEIADTSKLVEYKDDLTGVSFNYPKDWGTVTRHKLGDSDRNYALSSDERTDSSMDYSFSGVPLRILPILNSKNSYLAIKGGACYLGLGFLHLVLDKVPANQTFPTDWEQEGDTNSSNRYVTYSRAYEIDKQRSLFQSYQVGSIVSQEGYCMGLSVYGQQNVTKNTKGVEAVQFMWSETAKDFGKTQKPLSITDLETFKKDPKKQFSDKNMDDLRAVLSSVKTY